MNTGAEYTPTTEQVRDGYVLRGWADEPEIPGEKGWQAQERLGAGFDRWLAEHDKRTLLDAAHEFEKRDDTFGWDELHRMSEWLRARAATLENEATL